MNYLDFDRHMIRQRNGELLREVRELRLQKSLQTNRKLRSGYQLAIDLAHRHLPSLLRRANPSE